MQFTLIKEMGARPIFLNPKAITWLQPSGDGSATKLSLGGPHAEFHIQGKPAEIATALEPFTTFIRLRQYDQRELWINPEKIVLFDRTVAHDRREVTRIMVQAVEHPDEFYVMETVTELTALLDAIDTARVIG